MKFFIYDNLDRLIAIKTKAIYGTLYEELKYFDSLTAEFPKTEENVKDFRKAMYIGVPVQETGEYQLFKMEHPTIGERIKVEAIESASDDLDVQGYIDDRRLYDRPLNEALDAVFEGCNWTYELHAPNTINSINFYKTTRKDALEKLLSTWNLEAQFRYRTDGNRITERVCEIYEEIGQDTNKRLIKGKNVTSFEFIRDQTELYTAAIGRGAGLATVDDQGQETGGYGRCIEFDDVEWSKSRGNPVDKPLGQNYVEIPEATATYGWIDKNGNRRPRLAIVDFAEDKDKNVLLEHTYQWLEARSLPQVSVTTTVAKIGAVHLGDRMIAVDYGYTTLTVKARVTRINRDLLDDDNTEVRLGNYVILSPLERDEMAKKYVDDEIKRQNDQITDDTNNKLEDQENRFNNHIGQLQQAMKKEGEERKAAIDALKQDLNLTANTLTEKMNKGLEDLDNNLSGVIAENREYAEQARKTLEENWKETIRLVNEKYDQQVETIYGELQSIDQLMKSDTHGNIQLIKDPNDPTQINELIANNSNGSSFQLNGNGIVYRDQWGNIQSAMTVDGKVSADSISGITGNYMTLNSADINAGTITGAYISGNTIEGGTISSSAVYSADIYAANIYGALHFYDTNGGPIDIAIGGYDSYGGLSPDYGGQAIYVNGGGYTSMLSSGQLAVTGSNGTTRIRPSSVNVNGNYVLHEGNWENYCKATIKGWVQSWTK